MHSIIDKFPGAHPEFYRTYEDMRAAAKGVDVFLAVAAAHEVMAAALAHIGEKYPDWKKEFATQLRMTADWCEFMPGDAMCAAMTSDEVQALIDKHRFD